MLVTADTLEFKSHVIMQITLINHKVMKSELKFTNLIVWSILKVIKQA